MNISKDIMNKLYDELMTQEVTRLINLKREEVSNEAKIHIDKFLNTKNIKNKLIVLAKSRVKDFENRINNEIKQYLIDYDFSNAIEEYFESNAGDKVIDSMVKEMLAKGIK